MNAVAKDFETLAGAGCETAFDADAAVKRARQVLAPSMADRDAPDYPVAALGPLAPACTAIAEAAQVQPAMAGQALLGAASLLTQGLFNVQTLNGMRPLSLYLLTLGDSGEGKSTAQGVALARVNEWQRHAAKRYADELKAFEQAKAKRKRGKESLVPPAAPFRLVSDCTVEGLRRDLDAGPVSQGVFTDEAAAMLAGYGMSQEHRAKTASVFSKLWDAGHLSVSRATGGRVERYGRRVALHWLIQPTAASGSVGDPLLADLGFWPRFLAAWPSPQPPRIARAFRPEQLPAVEAYWRGCDELLAMGLPDDAGDCTALELSAAARQRLGKAFEAFEQSARNGPMRVVKPFGLRASEQACRVAGVLAAFAHQATVSEAALSGALQLVEYSLATWRSLIEEGAVDKSGEHALRLYEWLVKRPHQSESLTLINKNGPGCTRSKDKRDAAVDVLECAGLVKVVSGLVVAVMPDVQPSGA